jgi:putative acetyltransferase
VDHHDIAESEQQRWTRFQVRVIGDCLCEPRPPSVSPLRPSQGADDCKPLHPPARRTSVIIRSETSTDFAAVRAVVKATFPTSVEADLVDRLRHDGDAVFSLVAVECNELVGFVTFSEMEAPFRALGLGPVAVLPGHQRTGVGTLMIKEGLVRAGREGWKGVFVLGEPRYYRRFGFNVGKAAGFVSPYSGPHFMALALGSDDLPACSGNIAYPRAFTVLG